MKTMKTVLCAVSVAATSCSSGGADSSVAHHAAARLGVPADSLRVTSQSDLNGDHHTFYLVTQDHGPSLVVVVPQGGPPFDDRTEGAFDRVSRGENAAARVGQLGSEKIALWYSALGGRVCARPVGDTAHFVTVDTHGDGTVQLSYPTLGEHTCIIELAADGGLRQGRTEDATIQAEVPSWKPVRR